MNQQIKKTGGVPQNSPAPLVNSGDALHQLAARYSVDPEKLKMTLINTCMTVKDHKLSESEFIAFIIIANQFKLNPLVKEIYAFPNKQGGLVPIVSTDGWTNIMRKQPEYKNHTFRYADETVIPEGGKECPVWCEIIIEKTDGTQTVTREYLDEVYRTAKYTSPWQSHTKRMLRHKTKIQGVRETFGVGGIYDQDEAERIVEAQEAQSSHIKQSTKPQVQRPQALPSNTSIEDVQVDPVNEEPTEGKHLFKEMLSQFQVAKEMIGEEKYCEVLESYGFTKSNQIRSIAKGNEILKMMQEAM